MRTIRAGVNALRGVPLGNRASPQGRRHDGGRTVRHVEVADVGASASPVSSSSACWVPYALRRRAGHRRPAVRREPADLRM